MQYCYPKTRRQAKTFHQAWAWPTCATFGLLLCLVSMSWAQTTAFSYQGKLTDAGQPANGNYDLQFKLFDTVTVGTGAQQGATLVRNPVTTSAGVFTVTLDFAANVFGGADRYLEIGVRLAGNVGAYTTLAPRQPITASPYAIQTLNAQQLGGLPASRYIAGDASGNVGIGTTSPQSKLTVQASGYGLTHTSGAVTLGTFISTAAGGSGWLGTKSNHPLNFFTNDSLPQMTLDTSGNVGIGTTTPTTKLSALSSTPGISAIYGESATGRGVWGKSTSSRGVYGESTSLEGVYGISSSGTGVLGASTSGSGVYGQTAVSSLTAAGVYGKGIGSGSIGVIGESNLDNAVGVFGVSTSPGGVGVYARNLSAGRAIFAEGNVAQDLSSYGVVKAMLFVGLTGTIIRCYNGITNSSTGDCGFTITQPFGNTGVVRIDLGFPVSNRFVSVTAQYFDTFDSTNNSGANFRFFSSTSVEVFTFRAGDSADTNRRPFMIILY